MSPSPICWRYWTPYRRSPWSRSRRTRRVRRCFEYGALCVLHTVNNRAYLVQPAAGVNRLDALNHLTESYIAAGPRRAHPGG